MPDPITPADIADFVAAQPYDDLLRLASTLLAPRDRPAAATARAAEAAALCLMRWFREATETPRHVH